MAKARDADVLFCSGTIKWDWTPGANLIDQCENLRRRPNVVLILVTYGGNPDAAYRIARCLQQKYKKVIVCIPGVCKSAGTLITLAAHEAVMWDVGELGPLDIQVAKADELFESGSVLDTFQALDFLKARTYQMFVESAWKLTYAGRGQITFKTAIQLANALTTGLFRPLFEDLEPTKLGTIARQLMIAEEYGARLQQHAKNLKGGALQRLINHYPSHGFVIDRDEAKSLFINISEPTEQEKNLANTLGALSRTPPETELVLSFISSERK